MRLAGKILTREIQAGFCLILLLAAVTATTAQAQIPYHDPLPWYLPADSTFTRFLDVSVDRFDDGITHWQGNRVGLTAQMRAGQRGIFYFRAFLLAFNTAELPALERWPQIAGEEAEAGWPYESRMVGFANPELGLMAPFSLLLLGKTWLGLAVGLPLGKDKLYPLSSASFPLRAALRKELPLISALRLNLIGGGLAELDSAKDILNGDAFPDGFWLGASLAWLHSAQGWVALSMRAENLQERRSTRLNLNWWIPLRFGHSVGLGVTRELADESNRPFQTQFSLTFRLQSPGKAAPEAAAP